MCKLAQKVDTKNMTYSGRSEWSSFGCWSLFCPVQDILMSDLFQRWRAEKPKLMGWYFCGVCRCELGVLRTSPCLPQSPQVLSQAAANWRPHQKLQVRLPFVVPSFLLVPWLPSTLTVKLVHCFIYFSSPFPCDVLLLHGTADAETDIPLCWESGSKNGFPCSSLE